MFTFEAILRICFSSFSRIGLLCAALALGSSCGQEKNTTANYNITLNGRAVVWAGYAFTDPRLMRDLDATVGCLRSNGLRTRAGYPLVIVVDGPFNCNGILARGCTEIGGTSIYITKQYLYTTVFTHEVVHWETGMGNEYHDTPVFESCCSVHEM